jgi:hypothetical protein
MSARRCWIWLAWENSFPDRTLSMGVGHHPASRRIDGVILSFHVAKAWSTWSIASGNAFLLDSSHLSPSPLLCPARPATEAQTINVAGRICTWSGRLLSWGYGFSAIWRIFISNRPGLVHVAASMQSFHWPTRRRRCDCPSNLRTALTSKAVEVVQ